jgi:hypothetical protein
MAEPLSFGENKPARALDPGKIGAQRTEGGGPVNSTMTWKTAQTPSPFGMPISGHVFGVTSRATDSCTAAATLVVRDREAGIGSTTGAVTTDKGLVPSNFRGTSAWRPPTC